MVNGGHGIKNPLFDCATEALQMKYGKSKREREGERCCCRSQKEKFVPLNLEIFFFNRAYFPIHSSSEHDQSRRRICLWFML